MRSVLVVVSLVAVGLSGCADATDRFFGFDIDAEYRNPGVFDGRYEMASYGSRPLLRGNLSAGPPEIVRLESTLPAYPDPLAEESEARVDITMAIWRPLNYTQPVPIIVDAGPYFEEDCAVDVAPGEPCPLWNTIDLPTQTTPFNIGNFLPHGYAVVQLAVRGTGTSGGCMDLFGPAELNDLDQAITWLGEQPWSNGRIAMVGASYDGSTPWLVAASGNPYLKTIVPTSGLPDIYDLMFHNGSAEFRGPVMHNQVYWGFGFNRDFPQRPDGWPSQVPWLPPVGMGSANGRADYQDRQNLLCPEVVEASAMGQYTVTNGDRGGQASTYWTERDYRQRVIDNYEGSIFLVHGFQDWNVDPHVAIPFNKQLREAGFEMKEWYGQWGHAFPDSTCSPGVEPWVVLPCRLDFAEVLRRWFDHYLKGVEGQELGPSIQVQDNVGFWRNADSYPPDDAQWVPLRLSADGTLGGSEDGSVRLMPPSRMRVGNQETGVVGNAAVFVSEPFPDGLHLSGLPQIRLPFEMEGQGGQLTGILFDQAPDKRVRAPGVFATRASDNSTVWQAGGAPAIGYAQMNLRYYAGGEEPQPVAPGMRYVAQMEFEPLEVRVPPGHRLVLWLFQGTYQDRDDLRTRAPVTLHLDDDARLRLPTLDVDPRTVFPAPGVNFLNRTYVPQMYVPMPQAPAGPTDYDAARDPQATSASDARRAGQGADKTPVAGVCSVCP